MKDAAFCRAVLDRHNPQGHDLAAWVLTEEQAGRMEVFRFPRAGCFLAWQQTGQGRGLMQLAFSLFSRDVVRAISSAVHQVAQRGQIIDARTEDRRIVHFLTRLGFEIDEDQGGEIILHREPAHVL